MKKYNFKNIFIINLKINLVNLIELNNKYKKKVKNIWLKKDLKKTEKKKR